MGREEALCWLTRKRDLIGLKEETEEIIHAHSTQYLAEHQIIVK